MNQGEKLWKVFQTVWKVLQGSDFKDFGRALFFGTSYGKLNTGARRTVEALALKIGSSTSPAQVYVALASQSWGYNALKELGNAASKRQIFRELSTGNQERLLRASAVITWPEHQTPKGPPIPIKVEQLYPKPGTADPFEPRKDDSAGAGMLVVVSTVAALMLVGLIV